MDLPRFSRRSLFGISPSEATFERRGFRPGGGPARRRLEHVGETFLRGYLTALEEGRPGGLAMRLDAIEPEGRGFAYEGAAMALGLLDAVTPWRRDRFRGFLEGPGGGHVYMVHVGLGWAWARLGLRVDRALERLDPLLGWLALDGYGFHQGYFHWPRFLARREVPRALHGYASRAFDQGLGRSLWFVECADASRIAAALGRFPAERHADLWGGIGLACAYAGGCEAEEIMRLRALAAPHGASLAQGAAFAAKARARAGNPAEHTGLACTLLCGMTAEEAAEVTDRALEDLPSDGAVPSYELWRRRIQTELSEANRRVTK